MTIGEITSAERLRNHRVQAEQQADAEDRHGQVQRVSQADGPKRFRPETPDHHRVDDPHCHPAEFGENDRPGQSQGRPQFGQNVARAEARPERSGTFPSTLALEFFGSDHAAIIPVSKAFAQSFGDMKRW